MMRRTLLARVAWSLCLVCASLYATAFVLAPHQDAGSAIFGGPNALLTSLGFFTFVLVGAVIISRRGNHPVGWLFCLSGLAWSILSISEAYVLRTRLLSLGELPAEDLLVWASSWPEFIGVGAAPVLVLFFFPTGRLLSSRWRYPVAWTILSVVVAVIGSAFAPGRFEDFPSVSNPYGIEGAAGSVFGALKVMGWPLLLVGAIFSIVSLVIRFRRSRGEERQQMKWMVFAGAFVLGFLSLFAVSAALGNDQVAENLQGIALATVPAAAGIAILKYRLYDIDVVINRTLVYGALTAILTGAYFGLVVLFQRAVPGAGDSELAVAASTLAVAALFRPARTRIQAFIDHRFYRSKYDAAKTLESFGARLRDEVDLAFLRDDILGVVRHTVAPGHASVWLRGQEPRP